MGNLEKRYPSVNFLKIKARRRIPAVSWDYLEGGSVKESAIQRNRGIFEHYRLMPKYLQSEILTPSIKHKLLGIDFDAPFGIAPVGLSGLIWPKASEYLCRSAHGHKVPFCLSLFATTDLETVSKICDTSYRWFQYYPQNQKSIDVSVLKRVTTADYQTLVLTVDVPTTRKVRELRKGLTLPLNTGPELIWDIIKHPHWGFAALIGGMPEFANWIPHLPKGYTKKDIPRFLSELPTLPHQTLINDLKRFRDEWKGRLIVKGVLHPQDALHCKNLGVDAIIVSNHGGRQLDESPTALEMLPLIRNVVGKDYPLIVDGGFRHGSEIAVALALGANFVLLGRAFMYGIAALGSKGSDHVMELLKNELNTTLLQLGCKNISELPKFLAPGYQSMRQD